MVILLKLILLKFTWFQKQNQESLDCKLVFNPDPIFRDTDLISQKHLNKFRY